ncbi:MAG: PIG-L family deacetylase [Deltaproteobacteria bacterium]|jgi:LmbE family N-acetylglucosaminyl deacetylase|nr:PIG-L family deacetylase [Deltaproteobacteria bacterium]
MTTILVVSAHPDDETLFGGGTLAMYAQKWHDVFILETTRGEGGEVGEPPLTTRENLAVFREQEVREAADILGARDIFFLPYIDPFMEINGIARRIDAPLAYFAAAIATYVQNIDPHLVITHGSNGEYGHPQHIYTHQATRMALNSGRHGTALMTWSAWHTPAEYGRILNQDDKADIINDISPWHDVKVAAALCHKTQHAMFLRNSGAPSVADMVRKTEAFHIWQGPLPQDL